MIHHKLLLLALLSTSLVYPAEAGFWDWFGGKKSSGSTSEYGKGSSSDPSKLFSKASLGFPSKGSSWNPLSIGSVQNAGPQNVFSPIIQSGDFGGSPAIINFGGGSTTGVQMNWGPIYKVTIEQSTVNGDCTEKITINLQNSDKKKVMDTKCRSGLGAFSVRSIKNDGDFLLIGSPDEDICVLTTNKDEIYYLIDGKWKKGNFNGDNSEDKELSAEEIAKIKERVKKWQDFFEESNKEKERIRGLIDEKRSKSFKERERIRTLKDEERKLHYQKIMDINKMKTQERVRHYSERNKIYYRRSKEGWSKALGKLMSEEDEKYDKKMDEFDVMRDEEDKRSENVLDNYDNEISKAEIKYEEEEMELEALLTKEELKVSQEIKENIKQGW